MRSTDGTVKLLEHRTTGGPLLTIRHITGHTEYVKSIAFFKDTATLASVAAFNGIITFWDLKTSQKTGATNQSTEHSDWLIEPQRFRRMARKSLASVGTKSSHDF